MHKCFFASFSSILFLCTSLLFSAGVYEQDTSKVYKLSEIVVSATRTNTPSIEIASSVSVIDSVEIEASNKTNLVDLLKDQYGLTVSQSGGPGQLAQLYMRGANPGHVLVLIDGVKLNMADDPGETYDFANLPVDNIAKIEVLRGPQSTLYGSDAMAGVINIITKKGTGRPNYFFNMEGGSLNTFKILAGSGGTVGNTDYSITVSKAKSKGISEADRSDGNTEPDGYEVYNISSRFGWKINDNVKLNAYAQFNSGKTDLDQHGGLYGDDPTYIYKHQQGSYKADAEITSFEGLWLQEISFSYMRNLRMYNYDFSANNPSSSQSYYQGNTFQLEWQNNLKLESNLITFGLSGEKQNTSSADTYSSLLYGTSNSVFPENYLNTFSGYLQDQVTFADNIFTTAGIRYDNYGNIGNAITFRITQTYLIENTGTKLKAVYGTGFKAPSIFDLFDPNYGNKDLKSEKSRGWEAGFEQYIFNYNVLLGVTYFNNTYSDLIGYDNNYRSINIDKALTYGIESYLTADFYNSLRVSTSYTFTGTVDKTSGSADENLSLVRRPKNSASLKVYYKVSEPVDAGFDLVYAGKRDDKDFNYYPAMRVQLGEYTLLNLSASYSVSENVKIYGRIENAFDKKYEDVAGFGTAGRTAYLGVKLNIQ